MKITDIFALIDIAHKAIVLVKMNDVNKAILKTKLKNFLDDLN